MTESPATILYIDDDAGLRRLTARALERRGHTVVLAASGDEGIALARAQRFDLVAVDHYMPGRDGLETLAELNRVDPPPPAIFVTASDESRLAVAALKAGAIDYVLKTTDGDYFDLLAQAIDQALETVALRAANARIEDELRQSNERLQTLLHEANHRVANSLQLVSSLVSLQARVVEDPEARDALENTRQRIAAIAGVHRRLYTSSTVRAVEMAEYLGALAAELAETWSTPEGERTITLDVEPILLPSDQAVTLGIVVNELITNACKYAYPVDRDGEITVSLKRHGGEAETGADRGWRLVVGDHGAGQAEPCAPRGTGLGGRLIEAMATTLNATLSQMDNAPGLAVILDRPDGVAN